MVNISTQYTGNLHCELTHGPSGTIIQTDAPKDNMGLGEAFSPTDLVAAALSSCILTTMAIVAKRDGIKFEGAHSEITKEMTTTSPRRIAKLTLKITLPKDLTAEQSEKLKKIATHCPVHHSLHPDVIVQSEFV